MFTAVFKYSYACVGIFKYTYACVFKCTYTCVFISLLHYQQLILWLSAQCSNFNGLMTHRKELPAFVEAARERLSEGSGSIEDVMLSRTLRSPSQESQLSPLQV